MRDEYDFSKGERGKFFNPNADHNIPVYLDSEILDYFVEKARNKGVELDAMINEILKRDIDLIEGVK